MPALRYSGASGAQQPGQQIAVGLSLAQNYPLAITGTLNLAFNSEVFANDPAVQFAVGGRSVSFTIPAGQRDAVFQNGQTQMRLQTGTVAGAIVLTPSFSSDGGIALTPTNVESLTLTVAQSAPRLLNVQATAKTATGFTLLVTGYATARQLTTIDLTFTATSGENVPTTRVSLQADPTFTAWYRHFDQSRRLFERRQRRHQLKPTNREKGDRVGPVPFFIAPAGAREASGTGSAH